MLNRNKYQATPGGVVVCATDLFGSIYIRFLKGSGYGNKAIK